MTVQGPVKKQQRDGLSHRGGGGLEPPQILGRGCGKALNMTEILPPTISKWSGLFSSFVAYGHYHCDRACRSLGLHFKFGREHAARQFCFVI